MNHQQPANDDARVKWVALPEEARRRGLTTEALRRWCDRHDVVIRQATHRDAWVSPEAIDAAVERMPAAPRGGRRAPDELDADVDAMAGARGKR